MYWVGQKVRLGFFHNILWNTNKLILQGDTMAHSERLKLKTDKIEARMKSNQNLHKLLVGV